MELGPEKAGLILSQRFVEQFGEAQPGLEQCADPQGYGWLVTFVDAPGDMHTSFASRYQPVVAHKLSVDGTHLLACSDADRTACTKYHSVNIAAATGSVQEAQTFKCLGASGSPDGYIRVEFMGVVSGRVAYGDPTCSTSPVRMARPPWPPNCPRVKVLREPR